MDSSLSDAKKNLRKIGACLVVLSQALRRLTALQEFIGIAIPDLSRVPEARLRVLNRSIRGGFVPEEHGLKLLTRKSKG